jgi:hypothetical protein
VLIAACAALPYLASAATGAASGDLLWSGGLDGEVFNAVATSSDGSVVYATGSMQDTELATQVTVTAAYSAAGEQLWLKTHVNDSEHCCVESGVAIALSPDDSVVYVTGTAFVNTTDWITIAYDATTGDELWSETYDQDTPYGEGTVSKPDYPFGIAVSPDGDTVYVTGEGQYLVDDSLYGNIATIAYDAVTGEIVWDVAYDGGSMGGDSPRSMALSPDGGTLFVTGYGSAKEATPTDGPVAVLAYDTSDGSERWVKRYNPTTNSDTGWSVTVSPDGAAVYVAGGAGGTGNGTADWNIFVARFTTSTGSRVWGVKYDDPNHGYDFGRSVKVSPDGTRVYVAGVGSTGTGSYDLTTLALAAGSGATRWVRTTGGPNIGPGSRAAVAVSPDSRRVFVTGARYKSGQSDLVVVSYAKDGTSRWKSIVAQGLGYGLVVGPTGGKVFVAGSSSEGALLAYRA